MAVLAVVQLLVATQPLIHFPYLAVVMVLELSQATQVVAALVVVVVKVKLVLAVTQ